MRVDLGEGQGRSCQQLLIYRCGDAAAAVDDASAQPPGDLVVMTMATTTMMSAMPASDTAVVMVCWSRTPKPTQRRPPQDRRGADVDLETIEPEPTISGNTWGTIAPALDAKANDRRPPGPPRSARCRRLDDLGREPPSVPTEFPTASAPATRAEPGDRARTRRPPARARARPGSRPQHPCSITQRHRRRTRYGLP